MSFRGLLSAALTALCLAAGFVPAAEGAESDVNGDGHADLVTLRANGAGYVYGGGAGGSASSFLKFDSGTQGSFTLDPALFDGSGHSVVDVADVNADGRADQVTLSANGDAHVYLGQANKTFAGGSNGAGVVSSLGLRPSLLPTGQFAAENHEPVAVAKVDSDDHADLVVADTRLAIAEGHTGRIMIYRGNAQGEFGPGEVARSEIHMAVNSGTQAGEHFIDVADVTGDGRGDLISMPTWNDVWVRPGNTDGTFGEPSGVGVVDNAIPDGIGYEPAGVGDVNGDDRADLVLLKDNRVYTFIGQGDSFDASPKVSFPGGGFPSSTFQGGSGLEAVGVMDVNNDTHADLVAIGSDGNVYVTKGHLDGTFSGVEYSFSGSFESTQHFQNQDASGNEAVFEKPVARRRGCKPNGCGQQLISKDVRRLFAPANANIDIDGVDDHRVDTDIAIYDHGIDLQHPDLNVVDGLDCNEASAANDYACESDSPDDGAGDLTVVGGSHGTDSALGAAALDNGIGRVGVAPGARIWSLKVGSPDDYERYLNGETLVENLDAKLAAIKWSASNDIEVLLIGLPGGCTEVREGLDCPGGPDGPKSLAIRAAVAEAVDAGVTIVASTGNWNEDVTDWPLYTTVGGQPRKDYVLVSSIIDSDGLPGGQGPPANICGVGDVVAGGSTGADDSRNPGSGWGEGIDIAGPSGCGSNTIPHATGAAALLTSVSDPQSRDDVDEIRDTLVEAGNPDWVEATGGSDGEGDGFHEPLLDVHDEEVFDPAMTAGCARPSTPDVESDVDGDGYSDLVTLRPDGRVFVFGGSSSSAFETGVESFDPSSHGSPPLTPAQYIGKGDYVVDVADVTADGCADLVTLDSDGRSYVYQGRPDRTFGHGRPSFNVPAGAGPVDPALLAPGGHEPIAAADVNGDGHADLVTFKDQPGDVMVHLGNFDGTFDVGQVADGDVFSALHTAAGEYFVDAADVTGDGRADLVSMTTWDDVWVRPGKADGSFAAPVGSSGHTLGPVDTALDDGVGREPVGVGDVTKDAHADLVLHGGGTSYVYKGQSNGRFLPPQASFSGGMPSTTFGGGAVELFGVIDVNGDGYGDIAGAHTSGVIVAKGQSSGAFTSLETSLVDFESTQHFANQVSGHEIGNEKPAARRRGCSPSGCTLTTQTGVLSGFGAASRGVKVDLFWLDSGAVKQRWWASALGWSGLGSHGSPPGGAATSEPTAVAPSSTRDDVFVRGADQELWQKTWTDSSGSWSSWTSLGDGAKLASGPGPIAVSPTSGAMQVFGRAAADGSVWRKRWTSASGWTSWEAVPGTAGTTGMGVASSGGGVDLYMRDDSGNITQRWWTSASGWSSLGGHGSPQGLPVTSAPAAVSPTSSTVHVFVRGADRALWQKTWTGTAWTAWTSLGGVLRSGPTVVSPTSGEMHVFARGANDSFWRKRWTTADGWSRWEPVY